jgi:hypothetical protein
MLSQGIMVKREVGPKLIQVAGTVEHPDQFHAIWKQAVEEQEVGKRRGDPEAAKALQFRV